jgi:glutamine cyclotransferase
MTIKSIFQKWNVLTTNFLFLALLFILASCNNSVTNNADTKTDPNAIQPPIALNFDIIKTYPHDTTSYTEGLEWDGNRLIESTGNYNESKLRLLDSNMKDIVKPVKLENAFFGEGTTLFNDKIYQLTWKEHKVFVYDSKTLKKINELYWPYEGWGMTHDDTAIIINTGGSNIYYVDPNSFAVKKTLGVFNNYGYVSNINELEFVNGKLFGNVYLTDNIIQIDPITGRVIAVADLSNILIKAGVKEDPKTKNAGNVLNGIAYHKAKGTYFITGKDWPVLIELKFK